MKINFISKLFSHMPTLETDRLIFRALKRTDLYDIHEYSSNPKTTQYLLWEPHPSLEYTREFIEIVLSKYKSGEYNDWAIVHKIDDKMIGTCGFTRIDEENNVVEIGYVLNPAYWGKGIATEAVEKHLSNDFRNLFMKHIPLARMGLPEEIAEAVCYFASDASAYTTGQMLTVSGGFGLATPVYGDLVEKAARR